MNGLTGNKRKRMSDIEMSESLTKPVIDPSIFRDLQESIDRDSAFKDEVRDITSELDRLNRQISFAIAQSHSTVASQLPSVLNKCCEYFALQKEKLAELAALTSKMPYYKFNFLFTNQLQNASYSAVMVHWLGCDLLHGGIAIEPGKLLSIQEVAGVLGVQVEVGDEDVFHLTTEEYLHSLISLINEMSRLAVNSVTIGDFQRPLVISSFIKDLFSAFQTLNLKNDSLRRRYDSIKYDVKKVEEVVYDLTLRGLTNESRTVAPQAGLDSYLKVKTLTDTAKLPTRGSAHAAGYDMYASATAEIPAGGRTLVSTGLSIAVPVDCYARIAPRSGLAVKNGISTGAGVVDSDYRGEVRVLLFNQGNEPFTVNVGDRIAQMILERVYTPEVQQTDNLEESIRGAGGFGSTGA